MAKSTRDDMARQVYKRAVLQFLAATEGLDRSPDAGVSFWAAEARRVFDRQAVKLADVALGEEKRIEATEADKLRAERDAAVRRSLAVGKGERATVRESRGEAEEAWKLYDAACRELADLRARLGDGPLPSYDPFCDFEASEALQ